MSRNLAIHSACNDFSKAFESKGSASNLQAFVFERWKLSPRDCEMQRMVARDPD
jgi:hypothetical protein